MTSLQLYNSVAAFLHRAPQTFIVNGYDNLLKACNDARRQTERLVDFELARVSVDVPSVSLTDGGSLTYSVLHGTATPVAVKKIKRAFLAFTNGQGTFPIDVRSRDYFVDSAKRQFDLVRPTDRVDKNRIDQYKGFFLFQQGTTIFVTPNDASQFQNASSITVYLDVFKWLDDYGATVKSGTATSTSAGKLVNTNTSFISDGVVIGAIVHNTTTNTYATVTAVTATQLTLSEDIFVSGNAYTVNTLAESDFLLDFCSDWLMYAAIEQLNFFLKEDERVTLSERLVSRAWNGVLSWNDNLIRQEVENTELL